VTITTAEPVRLILAFAAIYFIWGSTYLGIAIAIETLPPFAAASARFVLAGVIVLLWCATRGRVISTALTPTRLARAAIVGTLMLGGGNGLVVWALSHGAPTGLTAVIIATTPFWLVAFDRILDPTRRIAWSTVMALTIGFIGIVILAAPGRDAPVAGMSAAALGAVLLATLSWATGTMIGRAITRDAATDPLVMTGIQMIGGGLALAGWSLASDDLSTFAFADVSMRSWIAQIYLTIFGSIIAYTAFIWLLRHASAAAIGTYAYVNPIVALALGVWLNAEVLTLRAVVASALVLGAVVTVTLWEGRRGRIRPPAPNGPTTTAAAP